MFILPTFPRGINSTFHLVVASYQYKLIFEKEKVFLLAKIEYNGCLCKTSSGFPVVQPVNVYLRET
jgi:hypothetical protein